MDKKSTKYNKNKTFKQWCLENGRYELIDQWDFDKNIYTPDSISYRSNESFYFKCPCSQHDSELVTISNIIRTKNKRTHCKKCISFAQYLISQFGEDALEKYWDYNLNDVNPWDISKSYKSNVYIKCQKTEYHGSYLVSPSHFTKDNVRCSYCFHRKVHPRDSLAQYCIDNYGNEYLDKYWDYDKNIVSPWDIPPKTNRDVYFKCINNSCHTSFKVNLSNFFKGIYCCKECVMEEKYRTINILQRIVNGEYVSMEEKEQIITFEDLRGRTFGRLTVIDFDYAKHLDSLLNNKRPKYCWICKCECNGEHSVKSIIASHLKSGKIISCGCWNKEKSTGANSWNWKGGVNSEDHKARYTPDGDRWRKKVLMRDSYTCQCCGSNKNLNVHHIYNFVDNIGLRYNADNGIVLCEECHGMTIKGSFHHSYGTKNNNDKQLREYILNKNDVDIYITHPEILRLTTQSD